MRKEAKNCVQCIFMCSSLMAVIIGCISCCMPCFSIIPMHALSSDYKHTHTHTRQPPATCSSTCIMHNYIHILVSQRNIAPSIQKHAAEVTTNEEYTKSHFRLLLIIEFILTRPNFDIELLCFYTFIFSYVGT
jgi:hypothetical protein